MRDKKLEEMAAILFPTADQLVLWELENPRAASLNVLQELVRDRIDSGRITTVRSASEAIRLAQEKTPAVGMVCFTGSLYLVGAARGEFRRFSCSLV